MYIVLAWSKMNVECFLCSSVLLQAKTWTKVASARSVVGMDKGIEGIRMISLHYWLQNMSLWHHSCLSLCAQSEAFFLILYWLCIVVPHRRGNLKSNVLFRGLLGAVGSARELRLGSSPLSKACLALFWTGCDRGVFRKYICTWCACACSLNVKFIVFAVGYHCIVFLSNRCSF